MNTEWQHWQRAVIKIGSALIAPDGQHVSGKYTLPIAKFINDMKQMGKEVILVSSGSVAAGRSAVVSHDSGTTIAEKQAMAAIGQAQMMANWQRFFDYPCAQLLITHGDLKDRRRYVNIKNTTRELLKNNAIPIFNENDTVATEELKVGDNDNLAALVALVTDADAFFICSDIDGLFDADPRKFPNANLIPEVSAITDDIFALAGDTNNKIATGGMKTKLQAALKTTDNGIHTFIINGKNDSVFDKLKQGLLVGTWFKPNQSQATAKKQWLRHTLKSVGQVEVDGGAAKALQKHGASLLAKGIVAVVGKINRGDSVEITFNGQVLAKGLVQYSGDEIQAIKGKDSSEFEAVLGFKHKNEVIHRDDLVTTDMETN